MKIKVLMLIFFFLVTNRLFCIDGVSYHGYANYLDINKNILNIYEYDWYKREYTHFIEKFHLEYVDRLPYLFFGSGKEYKWLFLHSDFFLTYIKTIISHFLKL